MSDLDLLLTAVEEAPDDDALWGVLADALLEVGDPSGELLALQLRDETQRNLPSWFRPTAGAIDEVLRVHRAALLGALSGYPKPLLQSLELRWRRGFIDHVTVDASQLEAPVEVLQQLLSLRAARLLGELKIATCAGRLTAAETHELLERFPARARALHLSGGAGTFSPHRLLDHWPRLRSLTLSSPFSVETVDANHLQELRLAGDETDVLLLLSENTFPALHTLGVWSSTGSIPSHLFHVVAGWKELPGLLQHARFPELRSLEIFGSVETFIKPLSLCPLAGQLSSLNLRDAFTRRTIDTLAAHRPAFSRLESLVLDGFYGERAQFPRDERRRIHELFPGVKVRVDLR